MKQNFRLDVNGQVHELQTEASTPLLYLLRNELRLNGPKFGCGLQQCGACMVLLNGVAHPSCSIAVSSAAHYKITTLEGLDGLEYGTKIKDAFVDQQAAQCGFCLNGAIVCATALLHSNPHPADVEIRQALERCLCRCGTQSRIIRAVKTAAQ